MAKKWNFKSLVDRLKKIRLRREPEDVPFYLPQEDFDQRYGEENSHNEKSKLTFNLFDPIHRPLINKSYLGILILCLAWFTGSLTALFLTPKDINSGSQKKRIEVNSNFASNWQTEVIKIKNNDLFKTVEPSDQIAQGPDRQKKCFEADKRSSLPIKLVNTVVLQDSIKSLASVQVRSDQELKNIREGETLDNLAEIFRINRLKVNFKNLQTGECEYISHQRIDDENKLKSPTVLKDEEAVVAKQQILDKLDGIKQIGNKICISRSLINEKMADFGKILQDARAIKINNPDGSIAFKIVEITPGSIYSHLNIQNSDIIKSINGKPITGLNEIMTLFGKIATLPKLNLELERDGASLPMKYEFTQNDPTACKE
jgi:type II secretory pathway component PulC